MQPASTSSVAHPDGATESQTQPPHPSGTRPRAADARLRRLPARQALGRSQSLPVNVRYTAPKPDLHPLIAAARQPRITERLDAMRQRLADLKADQALGWEAIGIHDTEFLDLLVAMENARHPELALSLHAIDHKALRDGNPSAVADLAGALATSMRTGKHSWHAILSTNGYQAAGTRQRCGSSWRYPQTLRRLADRRGARPGQQGSRLAQGTPQREADPAIRTGDPLLRALAGNAFGNALNRAVVAGHRRPEPR